MDQTLRVGNATSAQALAYAIYRYTEEECEVSLTCLGVLAVYQAVKAVVQANKLGIEHGYLFYVLPFYKTEPALRPTSSGEERTILVFRVKKFPVGGLWAAELRDRKAVEGSSS